MLKRTFAVVLSAALLLAIGSVAVPTGRAYAEMAPKAFKKETKKAEDKSGMSGAERRKKCSEEWQAAKAAGKTANQKWPQFYSACNKRLKGG